MALSRGEAASPDCTFPMSSTPTSRPGRVQQLPSKVAPMQVVLTRAPTVSFFRPNPYAAMYMNSSLRVVSNAWYHDILPLNADPIQIKPFCRHSHRLANRTSVLLVRRCRRSLTGVPGLLVDNASLKGSRIGDFPAVATASKSKYPGSPPALFSYWVTLMGGGRDLLSSGDES